MYATYEPKNLKEQFKELDGLQDRTLVPILNIIAEDFIKTLQSGCGAGLVKYGISDIKSIWSGIWQNDYDIIIDGKFVNMFYFKTDIDIVDDYFCLKIGEIKFRGDNSEPAKAYDGLKKFVSEQNSDDLKRRVAKDLQELLRRTRFDAEICKFYGF